ncbi:MAG TPA: hypothetical protein VHV29_03730 [Terriglobales bacterium]|jgi:hypothetical protein|nr:hypothetical protein [Terriglobales bacterium]
MKLRYLAIAILTTISAYEMPVAAQQPSTLSGPAVNMVVTADAKHGMNPAPVDRQDVMVYEGKTRDAVTAWVPAKGENADLELFILIDDSASSSLGTQLEDLGQFINSQPPTTKVGVAYMQDGIARISQNPTSDHAQAVKSLRLPLGDAGVNGSPYFSLTDLIKRWPSGSPRREVLMISDGIDLYYGEDLQDPYVAESIEQAQRAGIVVYAIYNPGAGHYARSYWRSYWGQLYLSKVTDETGGDSYYIGFNGPAVSFVPYLDQMQHRLNNQYLLTFTAKPQKKSGMQRVRLTTELPNTELVGADHVYVPASAE